MNDLRGRCWCWLLLATCVGGLTVGCRTREPSQLRILSHKDPFFPEPFVAQFDRCVFYRDRGSDLHVLAETRSAPGNVTGGPFVQQLHVHLYWRPRPGRTFTDPSKIDATVRYLIASPSGVVTYDGAGFVFPRTLRDGRLRCDVEQGMIEIKNLVGDVPDLFRTATLSGRLFVEPDRSQAIDLLRSMEVLSEMEGLEAPPPIPTAGSAPGVPAAALTAEG